MNAREQRQQDQWRAAVTDRLAQFITKDAAMLAWCEAWIDATCITDQTDPRSMSANTAANAAIEAWRQSR